MTTETLPELNTDLILDLIGWAERSQKGLDTEGWGMWFQGAWARITNRAGSRINWHRAGDTDQERVESNVCGTAFCMAGQTVVQAGYRLDFDRKTVDGYSQLEAYQCIQEEWTGERDDRGRKVMRDIGREKPIRVVAAEVLGLTPEEANGFFEGHNDLDRLKRYANVFADARGLPRLYPDMED